MKSLLLTLFIALCAFVSNGQSKTPSTGVQVPFERIEKMAETHEYSPEYLEWLNAEDAGVAPSLAESCTPWVTTQVIFSGDNIILVQRQNCTDGFYTSTETKLVYVFIN